MEKPRLLKSGKYQARYTGADGKRYTAGVHATKKLATQAAARAVADMSRGLWSRADAGDIKFTEYAAVVLEGRKGELTGASWKNFERQIRLRLNPEFGNMKLGQIRPTTVKVWWANVNTTPSNRRNAYMVLSSIMNHALDDELIRKNPCRVKGAGEDVSKKRPHLSVEDFWRLYDAASEDFGLFLLVTMDGGLRVGEATGLNRRHFDPKTGLLTIEQQFKYEPGGMVLVEGTKTSAEGRTLALSPSTADALRDHLKKNPAIGDVPMFVNKTGHRLSRKAVSEQWSKLRAEVGLEWVHIHDLRHTGLTLYSQSGATDKDGMSRAGHKDHRSWLRYQHTSTERDAALAAAMGASFGRKAQ